MKNIESLGDLFEMVGCEASFFDIGRRITKITPQQAIQFDKKQQAYPYPFRQHAWLACLLKTKDTNKAKAADHAVIWFIKLPLDESGALNLGTRDHFIKTIVDKILHKGEEAGLAEALEDSPYAFKPDQERMANFHAILAKQLGTPTSHYYEGVLDYVTNRLNESLADQQDDSWQALGLQGIAELAVQVESTTYSPLINKALKHAPNPFVSALCHSLEHHRLPADIEKTLIDKLLAEQNPLMQASYIRALSNTPLNNSLLLPLFAMLGNLTECSDEQTHPITALAAKCPHWLASNPQLLRIIMEKLAHRDDAFIAFKQIAIELSQHPETRQPLWVLLRQEHISATMAQAVSHLFTQAPNTLQ
ncbi:hypothetical protein MSP8887_02696 [Marinomonas spartinae]|uniref:DUF3549 family protein n=1 Tax=Marinomonas spartinae TaxID=1792290 RepID=UPI0008090489|nr:DUF3549 family protein [Marinomonas spartinae]SBS36742.1 hypothetical protein MSP8887_02696 [Marinomonas spartinae]